MIILAKLRTENERLLTSFEDLFSNFACCVSRFSEMHDYVGTGPSEFQRNGSTNAARAACYQGTLA